MYVIFMSTVAKRRAMAKAIARRKAANPPIYNAPYISGRGAYTRRKPARRQPAPRKDILPSNLGSTLGGVAGSFIGGPMGGIIGSGLGGLAQGLVKHITGFGDYSVTANTLMGINPPELMNLSKESVCLRHREYITDISAAANYTVRSFPINPGLVDSFPWLSGVANNFEEYAFTGMIYEFKTLSADYTTASSAALGYVAMATQYNALLPDFPDKVHLENYEFSNSAKPSESFIHPIECKRSLNPVSQLYVRTQEVEALGDQRLYDLGNFQIATGGNSGSGILGELWCTYEVCLYKPKLVEADEASLNAHYKMTSITDAAPLGSAAIQNGSTLPCTITGNVIAFPSYVTSGMYLLTYNIWGGSAAITGPTITATTNSSIQQYWLGDTVTFTSVPQNGVSAVTYSQSVIVRVTGSVAVLTFSSAVLPTSSTGDLWIVQVNDDIVS